MKHFKVLIVLTLIYLLIIGGVMISAYNGPWGAQQAQNPHASFSLVPFLPAIVPVAQLIFGGYIYVLAVKALHLYIETHKLPKEQPGKTAVSDD